MTARRVFLVFIAGCLWALFPMAGVAAAPLLERLVVEIEKSASSQRDLEVYMALRSFVIEGAVHVEVSDPSIWSQNLDRYAWDMIVDHEAQRLGSFQIDGRTLGKIADAWDRLVTKDPAVASFTRRLAVDRDTVRAAATTVLRVQAFISTKERQTLQGIKETFRPGVLNPKAEWFVKLEQRLSYRVFEGARNYVRIDTGDLGSKH